MWLCRKFCQLTFAKIGTYIGDHVFEILHEYLRYLPGTPEQKQPTTTNETAHINPYALDHILNLVYKVALYTRIVISKMFGEKIGLLVPIIHHLAQQLCLEKRANYPKMRFMHIPFDLMNNLLFLLVLFDCPINPMG